MSYRDPLEAARARIASLEEEMRRMVEQDLPNRDDALRQSYEREAEAVRARYDLEVRLAESEAGAAMRVAEIRAELETVRAGNARDTSHHIASRGHLDPELRARDEHMDELYRELEVLRAFSWERTTAYYEERISELTGGLADLDDRLEGLGNELSDARASLTSRAGDSVNPVKMAQHVTAQVRCETLEGRLRIVSELRARTKSRQRTYEALLASAAKRRMDD